MEDEIEQYSLNFPMYSNIFEKLKQEKNEVALKNVKKVLSSRKIIETISKNEIESLLNDIAKDIESIDAFEKTKKIVRQIYGEKAENILKDRGELSLEDIPNFDIFESDIIDTIGLGGVHSFLTYYMKSERVITEMANNTELIHLYKEFEKMTDSYFPSSAIGLEERLSSFYNYKELIAEIVEQGRQEELKDNLQLLLRDDDIDYYSSNYKTKHHNVIASNLKGIDLKPDKMNIEILSNYKETRNDKINAIIKESNNLELTRALVHFKFFGALPNTAGKYNNYEHKKFLKDYLTFHHSEFSDVELDLVELYAIVEDVEDIEVLKKINDELDKQENVIDPVQMKAIDSKVVESYKKEYLESLLTVEKAREMVENPNNDSYKAILKPNGDVVYKDHIQKANGDLVYSDYIQKINGDLVYDDVIKKTNGDIVFKDHVQTNNGNKYFYKNGYSKYLKDNDTVVYTHECENIFQDVSNAPRSLQTSLQSKEKAILKKSKGRGDSYNYRLNNSNDVFRIQENGTITRLGVDGDIENDNSPEAEQIKRIIKLVDNRYTDDNLISPPEYKYEYEFFKPEMFKVENGDVEQFVLYGIETKNLMISGIRDGATSENLQKKKLITDNSIYGGRKFNDSDEGRIIIEKNLEGGITTRSFYYKQDSGNTIGLAFTNINANSILGFCSEDAGTSHFLKNLRPDMNTSPISDILEKKISSPVTEVTTLRYEYDISKIAEGTKGGKVEPDYIVGRVEPKYVSSGNTPLKRLKKWAVAFSKPIITLRDIEKQDVISHEPIREDRCESSFMKKIKQIAESRKLRDIKAVGKEVKESYIDEKTQEDER